MESGIAIRAESISKKYCKSLRNSMFYGATDIGRNMLGLTCHPEKLRRGEFWVFDDISFEVKQGDVIGLIGPNGAGKTTLLKMFNGILRPDKGRVTVRGRVGALIAVGAGFHPLLTGRENIYINGAILGMSKREIEEKFDAIVDFADIGDFLDAPVKHYSSGMFVKLGFSVAIHCEPDILLIDEILAVGDTAFASKCYARMADLMKRGTTIVMVSHNMDTIRHMCRRAVFLWKGRVKEIGNADTVVLHYLKLLQEAEIERMASKATRTGEEGLGRRTKGRGRIEGIVFLDSTNRERKQFMTGETLRVKMSYQAWEQIHSPVFAVHFYANRILFASFISNKADHLIETLYGPGSVVLSLPALHLPAGVYTVSAVLSEEVEFNHIDWHDQVYFLQIGKHEGHLGLVALPYKWEMDPRGESKSSPVKISGEDGIPMAPNLPGSGMGRDSSLPVEKMLGQILVERNIISPASLQIALDRQKEEKGRYKYIGEILMEMGIPPEKINEALDDHRKRKPIGQIFVDLKIITPDQLQEALEKQNELAKTAVRKPLGQLLVEMGFTTYDGYMDALSRHFNMAIVSLQGFFPSTSLQRGVGKGFAQKHQIVVLEDYSTGIKLALAEPDPFVMDEVRRAFRPGRKVEFCLADRLEIDRCLKEM